LIFKTGFLGLTPRKFSIFENLISKSDYPAQKTYMAHFQPILSWNSFILIFWQRTNGRRPTSFLGFFGHNFLKAKPFGTNDGSF
jgi:hypothetical protein